MTSTRVAKALLTWRFTDGQVDPGRRRLTTSLCAIDALHHSRGMVVQRVAMHGVVVRDGAMLLTSGWKVLWSYDAARVLQTFAREAATSVLHLWPVPVAVTQFLAAPAGREGMEAAVFWAVAARAADAAAAWTAAAHGAEDGEPWAYAAERAAERADARQEALNTVLECMLTEGRPKRR